MNVTYLDLGVALIESTRLNDARGFFFEYFHVDRFREHGLPTVFLQDNYSRSLPRVLRGLHYQADPWQGKLVMVLRGRIWDVAVDVRPESPTCGRSVWHELNEEAGHMLWIPPGMAHGFCVLGDEPADVIYKVDVVYDPAAEGGIFWRDPELAIPWPIAEPIVSERDQRLPGFEAYRARVAGAGRARA